jgi:hypothetical protein
MLSKLKSLKWPGSKSSEPTDNSSRQTSAKPKKQTAVADRQTNDQASGQQTAATGWQAALKDPAEKKRLAAIGHINDSQVLLNTALQDDSEAVKKSAARQYAKTLGSDSNTRALIDSYIGDNGRKDLALAISAHHKDAALREYGSSLFASDDDLCALALETRFHDTRQSVAERLTSIDAIDKCWRGLKSKDKAVAKTLKTKLDSAREAAKLLQNQTGTTQKIIDEMERLATGTWSPNYTTRFELFEQQWQQLSFTPTADAAEKFQSFRHAAAEKVAANRERQKKHDECQSITDAIVNERDKLTAATLDELAEKYAIARKTVSDSKKRWHAADKNFDSYKDLEQAYDKVSRSLTVQLQQASTVTSALRALHPATDDSGSDKAGKHNEDTTASTPADSTAAGSTNTVSTNTVSTNAGLATGDSTRANGPNGVSDASRTDTTSSTTTTNKSSAPGIEGAIKKLDVLNDWFKQGGERTSYAAEIPDLLAKLKKEVTDRKQNHEALQNAIGRQFASLNSALASKRWGPARSIHERLAAKIDKLPSKDRTRHQEKLSRLEVKLNELGDWKQFATEPKLVSLCEQMEKLPDQGLAPKDQADRIKALQQQWKSMGASPALEQHWPRFKAAADTAFEPCAKYFAEKREEKNSKLKRRQDVCDMLESYLEQSDWEKADWKLVEKTLRTAKTEWRNTRVFDRKASEALDQRFTQIVEAINSKLEPAYEAGAQEKAELIEKVKVLAEGEVNQHCINQVKRLQGLWRRTGITRHKDDKKLWAEFNEHCSDVFSRHRGQQKEQYAASIQHVTRAKEIIRELKAIAKAESAIDEKEFQTLQEEFQALPEFPERDSKFLFRDFAKAVDGVESKVQKIGENSRSAELARIAANADICAQLERLAATGVGDAQSESERLLADWDHGEKSDNAEWKKSINARRDSITEHLNNGTLPDYEQNTLQRRILCIEAEILRDKATPASDRDLRMQHQLNKLQTGERGNINHSPDEESNNLKIAWLTALPAAPDQADALEQRFSTALAD